MFKILIVDDNAVEIRRPLVRLLGRIFDPESILEAENGKMALDILQSSEDPIGVIVLDVMMPVMDGITACKAIRSMDGQDNTYIIMLTGRDGGLPEGLEVGADVYIRKPCATDELIALVQKGLLEYEQRKNQRDERKELANLLHRVEEEKFQLQQTQTILDVPFMEDSGVNWLNLVDDTR
ncbi:Protein-glutamate methylesterase/protein-glutamine glutaminase [Candidatus Magnetaquicoccaceae bacterium FCR-1]|uniref:Protein-glutamate methylesterase/protein-glutamine glutaminase n=2 Tax=Candidatus Magnetaquiglobus chichijimensis TaxID=3141448 RepID=A0ABQ0CAC5_9PROT